MELSGDEKAIVDRILEDMAVLQKEFTRLFFYREVRRDLVIEKIAALHLKLAELTLEREITEEEISEKIREYHKRNEHITSFTTIPYLKLVK